MLLGLGHNVISVRPILGETDFGNKLSRELVRQTRWDRLLKLGGTDLDNKLTKEFAL